MVYFNNTLQFGIPCFYTIHAKCLCALQISYLSKRKADGGTYKST